MSKTLYTSGGSKSEAGVKEDIKKWLTAHRIHDMKGVKSAPENMIEGFFYMPVQNGMGLTGVSDFMICYHGQTIVVETKAENKPATPTGDQQAFIDAIEKAGGYGVCVNSLEMFSKWFNHNFPMEV